MLILFQISLDIDTKFTWVTWLFHTNSEAIEVLIVDLKQIDAFEPAEHVWNLYKSRLIPHKFALKLH